MKRLVSILLVFSLVAVLFASCSGSTDGEVSTEPSSTASEPAPAASASEPVSTPEETETATPDQPSEQPSEEPPAAEPEPPAAAVSLPIMEELTTYTMWTTMHPAYVNLVEDPANMQVWQEIAKRTNIQFDFTAVNGMAEAEQFSLMIVAGDYLDIINNMDNYSSGIDAAISDGVIIDILDLLKQHSPTYYNLISNDATAYMTLITSSGQMGTIASLYTEDGTNELRGGLLRKDWLDEFGLSAPETYDELHQYLTMAKDTYGAVMELAAEGSDGILLSGMNMSADYTVVDGEVKYGYMQDKYYDYLELVIKWYEEGIINPDFYAITDMTQNAPKMANGVYSFAGGSAMSFTHILSNLTDPNSPIVLYPIEYVTEKASDVIHVGQINTLIKDNDLWAISVDCKDPVPLLQLVEYMFSDEGYMLYNYGVEGVSYNVDESGEAVWTDLIVKDPSTSFDAQVYIYASAAVPGMYDSTKEYIDYTDEQWLALEVFSNQSDGAYNYPAYARFDEQEQTQYALYESEVTTYIESEILKFITGQSVLTRDAWQACVDQMAALGADQMIALKQAAYDKSVEQYNELLG